MGMLSSDTAQIFFEDVTIPADYVIGEEGQGFTYQMIQFQEERMYATSAGKGFTCCVWGRGWGESVFNTHHGKMDVKIFLMFIAVENTVSVNILCLAVMVLLN